MSVLPTTAQVADFPATPRRVRWTHWVRVQISLTSSLSLLVLACSLVFLLNEIQNTDLLVRTSVQGEAKIISKEAKPQEGKDDYYATYEGNQNIHGKYSLSLEEWTELEIGQTIPVWYAPSNPRLSQPKLPSEPQAKHIRLMTLAFVVVWALVTAGVFMYFRGRYRTEKALAVNGLATLAEYQIATTKGEASNDETLKWDFVDGMGKPRSATEPLDPSFNRTRPRAAVILVDPSNWREFKPWESFRWVEILSDSLTLPDESGGPRG